MSALLEALLVPAELDALRQRDLSGAVCVVFDVLRATSTIVTALAHGASGVLPVQDIPEALAWKQRRPEWLLAGERDGLRIGAALTGGVEFDLGNSPREFSADRVCGKTIVMTTTNGTRALRACARAGSVLLGSFLNLQATAEFLRRQRPPLILLVCAGTGEGAALEDVLGAGALCALLVGAGAARPEADSAQLAWRLYCASQHDLLRVVSASRNARRLLARAELCGDVATCLERNVCSLVAGLQADGVIRRMA